MIAGIFHQGSGLGNQLHRYVATRVLALDKGYDFGMVHPRDFKGNSFMSLQMGENLRNTNIHYYNPTLGENPPNDMTTFLEYKAEDEFGNSITSYDPEFNFVEDNTIIDGEFQDARYFEHRMQDIDEWLKVEPLPIEDWVCSIGFRGGEFALYPDLFLPKKYWEAGIKKMREINPNMKFVVHTDDEILAKQFFPDFHIIHDIEINWRGMRYAKYAIIANSSFYILPRLIRHSDHIYQTQAMTIAPRYWARHNLKTWSMPQNYYKQFTYI